MSCLIGKGGVVLRSGGVIAGSGDSIRVLVLNVWGGTLGTGGTSERTRVVPVRRTPDVMACRALSRAGVVVDVATTRVVARVVAEDVRREDTDEACGARVAGDWAGEVDTLVRW